jgi:DnaD/phage-associated family protein
MSDNTPSAKKFQGFPVGVTPLTEFPEAFFIDLLPAIDNLAEMKITLYAFWYIQQLEGDIRCMKLSELRKDTVLKEALTQPGGIDSYDDTLESTLAKAIDRGSLLMVDGKDKRDRYYFINTTRSKAIIDGYEKGQWDLDSSSQQQIVGLDLNKPDVYKLYENNIGLITPMIAEQLKAAGDEYPLDWIEDAIRIAVENNVRRWSYISRILASWNERGRNGKN